MFQKQFFLLFKTELRIQGVGSENLNYFLGDFMWQLLASLLITLARFLIFSKKMLMKTQNTEITKTGFFFSWPLY